MDRRVEYTWYGQVKGEALEKNIDSKLAAVKKHILEMGGFVEKALMQACQSMEMRDISGFGKVHEIEKRINEAQMQVDNECLNILATQGPVAKDLRFIMSILKINTDLERMGDLSVNIAYSGKDFLNYNLSIGIKELNRMSVLVRDMVGQSLDSFVKADQELAQKILLQDDEVDYIRDIIDGELIKHMKSHPQDVEPCMHLLSISRNLERLGDHATNIAEDVIFAFSGRDIRHGGRFG